MSRLKTTALITGVLPFALMLVLAGCKKDAETSDPNSEAVRSGMKNSDSASKVGGGGAQASGGSGEAIYQANGCGRCHQLNGQGGRMGPDLSHAGAEARHTADWIAEHIKNPKSHNPQSRMPAFEGKIADKDLQTLASYLASLK